MKDYKGSKGNILQGTIEEKPLLTISIHIDGVLTWTNDPY